MGPIIKFINDYEYWSDISAWDVYSKNNHTRGKENIVRDEVKLTNKKGVWRTV